MLDFPLRVPAQFAGELLSVREISPVGSNLSLRNPKESPKNTGFAHESARKSHLRIWPVSF